MIRILQPSTFNAPLWFVVAALLTGCTQTGDRLLRDARIGYATPTGWVIEDFPDHRGTYAYALTGPDEVEASVGIELAEGEDVREPDEIVEDFVVIGEFENRNPRRTQIDQSTGRTREGLAFGRVDFRVSRSGGDYLDSTYVIPVTSKHRVYVYTSVFEIRQATYTATIEAFLNSIRAVP